MASTGMSCSLLMTCRLLLPRFFVPSSGCLHSRKSQTLTARDNQPERSCHTSANHVRCAARPQSTSTSSTPEISSSFESVDCESSSSPRSTHYEIAGRTHECDDWSNLTPTVQRLIGRALHRLHNNPLRLLTDGLCHHFHDYTRFEFPDPVVTTHDNFDSLLIAPNHVSRSRSDTYYVNKGHLLRSHTSAHQAHCLAQLGPDQDRFVSIADVYRRDVIDSTHYPAFHQCELFRIYDQDQLPPGVKLYDHQDGAQRTEQKQAAYSLAATNFVEQQLKQTIEQYVRFTLGDQVEMRWIEAYFPFTHPSFELEILHNGKWIEMLGCGVVEQAILTNTSRFSRHIAFAVGFGLERLAMIRYAIPDIRLFWSSDSGVTSQFAGLSHRDHIQYRPISNHPQSYNDCSFWLQQPGQPNEQDFNELVREIGGDLIEQVQLIDQFENSKGQHSNCYRIVYRSYERTLTKTEVNELHEKIKRVAVEKFKIEMRS